MITTLRSQSARDGVIAPALRIGGRLVLAFVAALLLQVSAAGAEESVETGVNRPGRDYKDFDMEPTIAGFSPCQAACRSDPACRAWTYVQSGVQGPKAHCWLKKSVPEPVKNDCCVSGVSGVISGIEFDTNRPGKDYRNFGISNINVIVRDQPELVCRTACEKEAKCQAWTYVKPEKEGGDARCWLKNAVPKKQRNNCCTSGVVARLDPQEAADRNPTGKSFEQCEQAFARNSARCQQRFGGSVAVKIACDAEMFQLRAACLSLAAQANAGGGTTTGGGGDGVPAEWADTLSGHNAKRAIHRTPPLSWSASLAAQAQAWADGCSFSHADFNGFGENLFYGSSATGKDAVDWWYAEVQNYDWNDPLTSYNAGNDDRSKEVRHFTQVVWKATTTLGCGLAACGGKRFVVCRYQPPGNFNANNPGVLDDNVPARTSLTGQKSKAKDPEPAGDTAKVANVVQSVDVFDAPGGNGNQTGFLEAGVEVTLLGCEDNWCHVQGKRVPGGDGYVYNGEDFRSLEEE